MTHNLERTALRFSTLRIVTPKQRAERDALIGDGGKNRLRYEGMSTLTGEQALAEVDLDLDALGNESRMKPEAFSDLAAAYRRIITTLLSLDDSAVLANSLNGSYAPELRLDCGASDNGFIGVSHDIFLPFKPGGFIKVAVDLSGRATDLDLGLGACVDYCEGDTAGREADEPYNAERNEKCFAALNDYVLLTAAKAA